MLTLPADSALRAYYAKLQEQTASSRAVSESPSDDLADSLFEGVSPGAATATPPSSLGYNCEEERVTVNGNGKRSRQSSTAPITIELETTGEQPSKKVKVEGRESPTWLQPSASSVSVAAPPAEDSEDEGDFEEVA